MNELKEQYESYLLEVENQNFDIDLYDGDISTQNIEPMTFKEWLEDIKNRLQSQLTNNKEGIEK